MLSLMIDVDEKVVERAKQVATERDTTLSAMVREYLEHVAVADDASREQRLNTIRSSLEKLARPLGGRDWKRGDLYE